MGSDLHTLAYFSRNISGRVGDQADALDNILRVSRRNNLERGVTGALLFTDGWFAQVLEGPQAAVELIFEWIVLDSRHTDIRVLYLRETEQRSFGQWSMAFAGSVDAAALAQRGGAMRQATDNGVQPGIGQHLIATLQKLIAETSPRSDNRLSEQPHQRR